MLTLFFVSLSMMIALTMTLVIEMIVFLFFRMKDYRMYIAFFIINIMINLSMNYLLLRLPVLPYDIGLYVLEIMILIIEMFVYYLIIRNLKKSFLISLSCNIASLIIGLLLIPYIY